MSGGGPRTTSGKAITRRNALRHGVLSTLPVVPGLERPEDWQRTMLLASLAPQGDMETVLAERIALQLWRLHRVARYEAHLSRELYKAMHELEALQARRCGRPAPVNRLDVTGLPDTPKLRNQLPV